jgi:hypothetical protein
MQKIISPLLLAYTALVCNAGLSQESGIRQYEWKEHRLPEIPSVLDEYGTCDLVIIKDEVDFHYLNDNRVTRNVLFKINTAKGVEKLSALELPESFDKGYDLHYMAQGIRSRFRLPAVDDFRLKVFGSRKFANGKWSVVPSDYRYERRRKFFQDGLYSDCEYINVVHHGLMPGDLLELHYEADFSGIYGTGQYYLHDSIPKLKCDYSFEYTLQERLSKAQNVLPVNVPDSLIQKSVSKQGELETINYQITSDRLEAVRYPIHSRQGKCLPHVCVNFSFQKIVYNTVATKSGLGEEVLIQPGANFSWRHLVDTTVNETTVNYKQTLSLRKFLTQFPSHSTDSSKFRFLSALCDSFGSFQCLNPYFLNMNDGPLYELYSGEHLLKRRWPPHKAWKLWMDLLQDSRIFYYVGNMHDQRYGDHDLNLRPHYRYEGFLLAVPTGSSYNYFVPRTNGVALHLNELPFYYEGALTLMNARNFQPDIKNKMARSVDMVRTRKSGWRENLRTENALIKVSLAEKKVELKIKESLSGQFSTLLRHLYLGSFIDSSVSAAYFRKCSDKPLMSEKTVKLLDRNGVYPFRYTFACSGIIPAKGNELNMTNWFSFTLSRLRLPEVPRHDYYFDFVFTDSYNYSIEFDREVEFLNKEEFSRKLSTAYYELESELAQTGANSGVMRLRLILKKDKIPAADGKMLCQLADHLDFLNSYTLKYKVK